MKLFSEKVNPTLTNSSFNILQVEAFEEIFFGVYEIEINKSKYPVEKVSEHNGNPVVSVPVVVEGVKNFYPFILVKGKFEVVFNKQNTIDKVVENFEQPVEIIKETVEEDEYPVFVEEEISIPDTIDHRKEILEQIKKAKQEATVFASKIKKQKLEEANKEIRVKKQAIENMVSDARSSLVKEFISISGKIKDEFIVENDERFDEIKQTIDNKIQDMSDSLMESLRNDFSNSEKEFDSKIRELIKELYESINPKIDKELKNIATEIVEKVDSIEKNLSKQLEEKVSNEIDTISKSNIELNDKINKGVNRALSRVGNIDKRVDDLTIAISEEVNNRIGDAENYIKDYYNERIQLLETQAFDLNEKTRQYFIDVITDSKNNLIDDIRQLKNEKPIEYIIESKDKKTVIKSDDLIKDFDKKINSKIDNEVTRLRKYIAVYSGGGSVAMQFADGGTMNGNLVVVGSISASNYLGIGSSDDVEVSTKVRSSSSYWDSNYATVNTLSSNWQETYTTVYNLSNQWATDAADDLEASTKVRASSANWDSTYSTVNTLSVNWGYQGLDLKALSSNWQETYTTVLANSVLWATDAADDLEASTKVRGYSANWDSVYTTVNSNSADWNYQGLDLKALSSNWQDTYTTVLNNSAGWSDIDDDIEASTKLRSSSAFWDSTYNTLTNLSTNWDYQGLDLKALSSNWQSSYTTVLNNSAAWGVDLQDDVDASTKLRSSSANWDSTYVTVLNNSAGWSDIDDDVDVSTKVRSSSAFWDSTYNTVTNLSVNWDYQGLDLKALSSNWQETYLTVYNLSTSWGVDLQDDVAASTKLRASSAAWDSTYVTVLNNSAGWSDIDDDVAVSTKVRSSSAFWDSTYNTVTNLSTNWNYQGLDLKSLSSNWQETYLTVLNQSAGWSDIDDDVLVSTKVRSSSAFWDSTYVTVLNNSSMWAAVSDPVTNVLAGNGLTSVYTISGAENVLNASVLRVSIDGAAQTPEIDYTVNDNIITFTTPLADGALAIVVSPNIAETFVERSTLDDVTDRGNHTTNSVTVGGISSTSYIYGSHFKQYVGVSSTYTVLSTDEVVNCTANSFTVTLPPATGLRGKTFIIKNSGVGTITLSAGQTMDGVYSINLVFPDSLTLLSTGAEYIII